MCVKVVVTYGRAGPRQPVVQSSSFGERAIKSGARAGHVVQPTQRVRRFALHRQCLEASRRRQSRPSATHGQVWRTSAPVVLVCVITANRLREVPSS